MFFLTHLCTPSLFFPSFLPFLLSALNTFFHDLHISIISFCLLLPFYTSISFVLILTIISSLAHSSPFTPTISFAVFLIYLSPSFLPSLSHISLSLPPATHFLQQLINWLVWPWYLKNTVVMGIFKHVFYYILLPVLNVFVFSSKMMYFIKFSFRWPFLSSFRYQWFHVSHSWFSFSFINFVFSNKSI